MVGQFVFPAASLHLLVGVVGVPISTIVFAFYLATFGWNSWFFGFKGFVARALGLRAFSRELVESYLMRSSMSHEQVYCILFSVSVFKKSNGNGLGKISRYFLVSRFPFIP